MLCHEAYNVSIHQNNSCNEALPSITIDQESAVSDNGSTIINNVLSIIDREALYIAIQISNEIGSDTTEFI